MKIEFEGRTWQFDEDEITVKQGIAIHLAYGFTVSAWLEELAKLDPRAVQCTLWLMYQQNGVSKPIADCDGSLVAFMTAYTEARQAEAEADAAAEAEAVPEVPTSLPPGDPAWSGQGFQTDTTQQQPGQHPYQPQHTGYSPSP